MRNLCANVIAAFEVQSFEVFLSAYYKLEKSRSIWNVSPIFKLSIYIFVVIFFSWEVFVVQVETLRFRFIRFFQLSNFCNNNLSFLCNSNVTIVLENTTFFFLINLLFFFTSTRDKKREFFWVFFSFFN